MSEDDRADILGTRESTTLEFKRTAKREGKRGDAIANAVCAMANDLCGSGGGDILVGVDDNGDPIDGVDTGDRALLALTDLRDDGRILATDGLSPCVRPGSRASPSYICGWRRPSHRPCGATA
ncbi:helix-turn-helix domain-containing protein [Streptomyces sp. NPDC088554]|uniref:AlbA family DNA-binding domain-containing protein n=1 Tax=Streptomyces sp. NPDC088554 TaxID=3365865 RepID=UPI00381EC133